MKSRGQRLACKRPKVVRGVAGPWPMAYGLWRRGCSLWPIACSLVLFLLLISATALAGDGSKSHPAGKEQVGMRFENIALSDFVNFVSEYTGTNIVYDPAILRGNVTIKARKEFSRKDLLEILSTVLKMNNLEMTTEKGITYIANRRGIMKMPPRYTDRKNIKENKLSVTVFQVEQIDAKSLSSFLNIMKSDIGRFVVIPRINTVIVKDKGENLKNISRIIDTLSRMGKGVQIGIFPLKYTQASEFINSIKSFFTGLNKLQYTKVMPVFMADRSSNSIVVAALPEDMAIIKRIIARVDIVQETATKPRVIKLKYARAEDVEKILNKILTEMNSPARKGKLPALKKTIVAADKATNTISVVGDPEVYARVESLIEKLDIPRDQIFVEALIIETTLEEGSKFGVEWLAGAGDENTAGAATFLNSGDAVNFSSPVLEGNPPNLSALPGGFSLGILGNIITYEGVKFPTLTALVNAIKSKSGINILSKPQLLTLDNEEAEVFVGENRPFLISEKFDANNNPIQTFDYRDVGIKLKILPHVVDEDTILLTIKQEVKKVIATATGVASAPITLTRSTNTTVKVKDNMTIVISGLIKNDNSVTETRVPILSDIPILGWLFRSTDETTEKTNMMVFITTRIIRTRDNMEQLTREKRKSVGYKEGLEDGTTGNESREKTIDKTEEMPERDGPSKSKTDEKLRPAAGLDTVATGEDKGALIDEIHFTREDYEIEPDYENPFIREDDQEIETQETFSPLAEESGPGDSVPDSITSEEVSEKAVPQPEEKAASEKASVTLSPPEPAQPAPKLYAVQVGFFKSLKNANNLYHSLLEKGYNAVIKEDTRKDGYRVIVGKFNALLDAVDMKERLKKAEGLEALIYSY